MLRERGLSSPVAMQEVIQEWESRGAAVLSVVRDNQIVGALMLEDQVRPESREAVKALHDRDVRVVMITGDSQAVAERGCRGARDRRGLRRSFARTERPHRHGPPATE